MTGVEGVGSGAMSPGRLEPSRRGHGWTEPSGMFLELRGAAGQRAARRGPPAAGAPGSGGAVLGARPQGCQGLGAERHTSDH